jgi:hypothetical protein
VQIEEHVKIQLKMEATAYSYNNIIDKKEPDAEAKAALEALLAVPAPDAVEPSVIKIPEVDAFVVMDILSASECDAIVSCCEAIGYTFWSNPESGKAASEESAAETQAPETALPGANFRTAYTIEIDLPALSKRLSRRLNAFVRPATEFTPEREEEFERDLEGTWVSNDLAKNLLFARYRDGGHFAPHIDGQSIVDFNERTMYSVLFYLNDCASGGETHVISGDQCGSVQTDPVTGKVTGNGQNVVFSVKPRRGSCVVFRYNVLHEGAPVQPGHVKYIIRGDVLYRRDPPQLDTPADREAFDMYQRARVLEANGNAMEAVKLFQRIRKISPGLADVYQL